MKMKSWGDVGICLPSEAHGEVRMTCPQCSASRRKSAVCCLAVNADRGTWLCHHCGWKGSLRGCRASAAPPLPPLPRVPSQSDARNLAVLRRVWSEAAPLAGDDPVLQYFRRRDILLPLADMPLALRYHPHLAYRHDDGQRTFHPAMLARVDDAQGEAVSLHRTYLTPDGQKAAVPTVKKLLPPVRAGATRGGAIRLYPAHDVLAITEGIETALAVRLALGLPVWAAVCAGGMQQLVVPPAIRLVLICADHDPVGLAAAKALARRLLAAQHRVKILAPETPGADWADRQEVPHA